MSNPEVATVDNTGRIIAQGSGEATVTASCSGISADCKVYVTGDPQVGDFYYADGKWFSSPIEGKQPVGIIFYVGDPTKDDPALKNEHPECRHGLIRGLYPGSWYYAIAVGMDDGGNRTTSFVTEKFQAAPIEMNGATFTMSWDGDRKEMTVTPSTDDIRYFYGALKQSEIDNMDMSLEESLKSYFDEEIAYGLKMGFTREETMDGLLSQGKAIFDSERLHPHGRD